MKKLATLAAMAILIPLLGGCSLLLTQVATDFSVSVEPEQLTIAPGESGVVEVAIDRILPVDVVPTPVYVTLHRPPEGVSADELEIPSGISEDDLEIRVASGTEPTGPVEVTVRATNGLKTHEATFELTIAEQSAAATAGE